ncbi:MAG: cache domain-containing protein, partial [Sedimenticolaceae bacterium]
MKINHAVIGAAALSMSLNVTAGEMGSPDEAKALSEKAAALVNQEGEGAFETFSAADGGFVTKDLYVFCMDLDGKMLSHAKKPELVGKNLSDFNKYGDMLFKDMIAVASDPGTGWVD